MQPTPFTVIGGLLGAGKTTLLLHWLRHTDRRLAVLVNDFGAVNIDAALVAGRGAETIALANGCVCCSIGDDLGRALDRVLGAGAAFDGIVVEASGVSDPWRIAQYARVDPRLVLDGVLVVVDADAVGAQAADPLLADTLGRALAHADLVLLNKADLVDAAHLHAARARIEDELARTAARPVPVIDTRHGAVPLALLHAAALGIATCDKASDNTSDETGVEVGDPECAGRNKPRALRAAAHDRQFESWSHVAAGVYDGASLAAWLEGLPPSVLRVKGWLPLADGRWAGLQRAGRRDRLRVHATAPAALATAGTAGTAGTGGSAGALVAIARRGAFARDRIDAALAACRVPVRTPGPAPDHPATAAGPAAPVPTTTETPP